MGRAPCCEKVGLKRGRWTAEEDEILLKYIQANGEGSWRSLPKNAGLMRCGKSCRLRWINYLRTDLKRGNISPEEEQIISKLHSSFGNRWSLIAGHLPGRTDNEIKNYWNSHLSRRILRVRRPNNVDGVLLPDVVLDIGKIAAGHGCKKRSAGRTRRSAMKKNKAYGEMRRSGILLHARAAGSFSTTVEKAALLKDAHHVPVLGVENDQVAILVPGHEEKIINDHHHHVLEPVLIHEKEAAEINDEGMKSWEMGGTEEKGEKGSSTEINNGLFFSVDQVIMETEVTTGHSTDQERESTSTGVLGSNELDSELSGGVLAVLLEDERENGIIMGANHEDQWFESDHQKDNINEWCNSSNLDVDSFDQEMGYNILQDDEWLDWKWPDGVVEDMMVLLREEEDGGPETTWSWLWESDNEEGQQCLAIGHEQEDKYAAWLLSADTNNYEL